MNYDEYIDEVAKYSGDDAVDRLVSLLKDWKSDSTTVIELAGFVERYFGNSWISDSSVHNQLYLKWTNFSSKAVLGIGGMTFNERLYLFGLIDIYDKASAEGKQTIYDKLLASGQ